MSANAAPAAQAAGGGEAGTRAPRALSAAESPHRLSPRGEVPAVLNAGGARRWPR